MPLLPLDPQKFKIDNKPLEPACAKCKLCNGCLSPKMKPSGKGKKNILIVAEAPGKYEDQQNTQLVGDAGQTLRSILDDYDIDLDDDCIKTNAIRCRPPGNRTPTNMEIQCCRPSLMNLIKEMKPHIILPLGGTAIVSLITDRVDAGDSSINTWRGFQIPDQELHSWVCPSYHPSYIMRHTTSPVAELIFREDLKKAFSLLHEEIPDYSWLEKSVVILRNSSEIKAMLQRASVAKGLVSFDYEASGLKPYRKGHFLSCAAVAFYDEGEPKSYSFMVTKEITRDLKFFLVSDCKKVIANTSYERLWSEVMLNTDINNIVYDPIIGQHVLDNRSKITGVKFQTYAYLGIPDYSSHVSKYLKAPDKIRKIEGSHAINCITKIHPDLLMKYNGMDSMVELIIAEKEIGWLGL